MQIYKTNINTIPILFFFIDFPGKNHMIKIKLYFCEFSNKENK